jgi:transposase InsO family protein
MIAFIDDHRAAYGVEPICKVLPIAPSTYHAHAACRADPKRASARAKSDAALSREIQRVWDENFQVYGIRKVWRQLKREGIEVARCTVARLMRRLGLKGATRGKPVRTTISDKATPCPADKVNRQFQAPRPNALWVADFTYVATWQGAYFGESALAFRFKPPTVSVISPTLLMGLVGERRRDPWFSPYAGIAGRAKRHDDDEGSVDFWSAARTRRMDSPVSSIRSAR